MLPLKRHQYREFLAVNRFFIAELVTCRNFQVTRIFCLKVAQTPISYAAPLFDAQISLSFSKYFRYDFILSNVSGQVKWSWKK
jgi:hypothetical protein